MASERILRARAALVAALTPLCGGEEWRAKDVMGNVSDALEDSVDLFADLRLSTTLRRHVRPEDLDDAVSAAGLAWLRALAEEPPAPRSSQMQRFAAQVAAGVDPRDAAHDAREGGEA